MENAVRSYLAREIMAVAIEKHIGHVTDIITHFLQFNVNFLSQPTRVLIIDGTIYHKFRDQEPGYLDDLRLIASGITYDAESPHVLRPNGPVLLDASYLVSVLGGLYDRLEPERALRLMKRELRSLSQATEMAQTIYVHT